MLNKEQQFQEDCEYFEKQGSKIIEYPSTRASLFKYSCKECGKTESYLSIRTFYKRTKVPLCKECAKKKAGLKHGERSKNELIAAVESLGGKVLKYTRSLEPVTLLCHGCLQEFTYSTHNNLIKRNPEFLCEKCLENTRAIKDIQENIKFFEEEFQPILNTLGLKIRGQLPINKEDYFPGFCSICGTETLFPNITVFLFNYKKDSSWRPLCKKCVNEKISISQRTNNLPGFLREMRTFFREHGSKLLNKPQSTKDAFEFVCFSCKKISRREDFEYFRKTKASFICKECSLRNAGAKRRIPVVGPVPDEKPTRKDLFEYYNTWTNNLRIVEKVKVLFR